MRLPLIAQADLAPEQRPIYEDMRAGIENSFQGFTSIADNGVLLGPWNPWLHERSVLAPLLAEVLRGRAIVTDTEPAELIRMLAC
jgi:4-carboxymuconolactone decarboxylase